MGTTEALISSGVFVLISAVITGVVTAWAWWCAGKDWPVFVSLTIFLAPCLMVLWLTLAWGLT